MTGKQAADVACLICGDELRVYRIERDEELIERLISLEAEFWSLVETRQAPEPDGSDSAGQALRALYPRDAGTTIDFTGDLAMSAMFSHLLDARAALSQAEAREAELKQKLQAAMGEATKAVFETGEVTWKRSADGTAVDTARLLKERPSSRPLPIGRLLHGYPHSRKFPTRHRRGYPGHLGVHRVSSRTRVASTLASRNKRRLTHRMFGHPKPIVFTPYGRRRSNWRLPRWVVLMLSGMAVGAAGVVLVQERYLPPRLSADASERLTKALEASDAEGLKLADGLGNTAKQLESALADNKILADKLATSRATTERLRADVASAIASLPPDPRGGAVEVRAGRFTATGGVLTYEVVLTRQRPTGKPVAGVMQLVMDGESGRGSAAKVTSKTVALSFDSHEIVRGSLPLPEDFRPRQTTIQVLDRVAGKLLGTRVMLVS